jgi:hypothetical protein
MRSIGVLMYLAADDPDAPARVAAFARGLKELNWIEGRNTRIEYRWGGGDPERVRKYAAELVALAPDVILVSSGSALAALQNATRTVPIFFKCHRPRWRWLRRKPCASRCQYDWIYPVRIRPKWEVARAAQTDNTGHDASGGPSKSVHNFRNWPVRCNPGSGTVARGGVDADRCA